MLREAATGPVIGGQKGYAGDYGPAIEAWLDTPGGVAVAPNGDVYIADSNNHVIRRIDARSDEHRAGRRQSRGGQRVLRATTGRPPRRSSIRRTASRSPPTGISSSPTRTTSASAASTGPTGVITTIAGSGENGYDGDDQPALQAALNTPSAVAAAPNGDIYIADTLNYRVRMIDAKTGLIHTVAGNGEPGDDRRSRRRRRTGDERAP